MYCTKIFMFTVVEKAGLLSLDTPALLSFEVDLSAFFAHMQGGHTILMGLPSNDLKFNEQTHEINYVLFFPPHIYHV